MMYIFTNKLLILAIQDNISQLKTKMASNAKECDERNRLIKEVSVELTLIAYYHYKKE